MWIIYDVKHKYGYFYDLNKVIEIPLDESNILRDKLLNHTLFSSDELDFQQLWQRYFNALAIYRI